MVNLVKVLLGETGGEGKKLPKNDGKVVGLKTTFSLVCGKMVLYISVGINLADVVAGWVIGANRGGEEWGEGMQARIYQQDT